MVYRLFWTPSVSYKGNVPAMLGITISGSLTFCIYLINFTAWSFAVSAGINVGVISSVLTSAVFFAALFFYLAYHEKLSWGDWLGAVLIVGGTSMIGLFTPQTTDNIEVQLAQQDVVLLTWYAILLTFLMSACIAASILNIRYHMDNVPFTPWQFNLDGYMVSTIPMTIGIAYIWVKEGKFPYDLTDIAIGSAIAML